MNNALRTRQRMFALALPLTAALYIGAEGLDPKGTDQIVTTTAVALKVLPIAAKHHTQLYALGFAHRAGARGRDHLLRRNRHADPKAWVDGCHRCGSAWRDRCLLRCHRQRPRRHQSRRCCDSPCDARCGCTTSGHQLQFGARSGVHRRLCLQRVRGADHHGSRPLAQRSCTTLARSSSSRWALSLPNRRRPSVWPRSFCKWRRLRWRWFFLPSGYGKRPS